MFSRLHSARRFSELMLFLFCVACWSEASEPHFLSSMPETQAFGLQTVQLKLEPETYRGKCPVDITAEGMLLATETVTVQYRWLYQGTMGKIATLRLNKNKPETVTTIFKNIGNTPQVDTLILSSNRSTKPSAASLYTATVQLLSLPMGELDWSKARTSAPVTYRTECETDARFETQDPSPAKADLVPGPGFTMAGANTPWGSALAIDASPFQAARRGYKCSLPFTYELINLGEAEAGTSQARLFGGSLTLNSQSIGKLAPAEKVSITDNVYLSDGRHDLGIRVDDSDQVAEINESNNLRHVTVMVRGCSSKK